MDIFVSKKLKYFMVVMQKKNLSKAAEALCITRSPLSKKINELESLLGAPLFKRCGTGLAPTLLARDYYEKCKETYEKLCTIDDEILESKKRKDIHLLFDISFPTFLTNHIQNILELEKDVVQLERRIILPEDIQTIKNNKKIIAISLREIPFAHDTAPTKWCSEGFSLLFPDSNDPDDVPLSLPVYVWRDSFTSYIKETITKILKCGSTEVKFIEHNFPLCSLMHLIKSEKGCAVLPFKFAQTFKIEGVKTKKIPYNVPYVNIYHHPTVATTVIDKLKATINLVI